MQKILIIGGYGAVGSIISTHLSKLFPHQVVVSGRNINKAKALAAKLNHTVIPYELDLKVLHNTIIFKETTLVIMCIDEEKAMVAEFCASAGIHYIDITASYSIINKIEKLHSKAVFNKSSILLSVGLAPGISNLLARHSLDQLPQSNETDLFILLGSGEQHGEQAYRWTFDNIHTEYILENDHQPVKVKSFTSPKTTILEGKRKFYLFNFSDQHVLNKIPSVKRVTTRMAFDSVFLTNTVAMLRKTGITKLFTIPKVQSWLISLFSKLKPGSDIFAVKATAINSYNETYSSSIKGNGEGKITAFFAVQAALLLLQQPAPAGVYHSHEFIQNIPDFLRSLQSFDKSIEIEV